MAVLAIFIWPRFARQVRVEVLQLKSMDYVSLAKVFCASTFRNLFIQIFAGTINTLIVVATLQVGVVILLEATLASLAPEFPLPLRLGAPWLPKAGTSWLVGSGGFQPSPASPSC